MAYRKSYRRSGGRRRTYGRGGGITANAVKRIIRNQAEVKRIDSSSTAGVDTSGTLTRLSNIGQGTADNQRIGSRVRAKTLYLSGIWQAADTTNFVRVMIVRSNARPLTLLDMPSLYGIPDNQLMHVAFDRKMNLANATGSGFDIYQKAVSHKMSCHNMQCHWDESDNPLYGQWYVYMLSDSVAPSNPTFSYECAFYYTDV